jgi:hypothetical protein
MNRSLKFGLASVIAAVLVSLVALPDDAEARHHRRGRRGCGGWNGCGGHVSHGCCGVAVAPSCSPCGNGGYATSSPCGAGGCVTSAPVAAGCTNCTVGGAIQGGYSAAYPATNGTHAHGTPSLAPAAPALNGTATPPPAPNGAATGTFREDTREGAATSPSDRTEQTNGARTETRAQETREQPDARPEATDRSAPPPPPER